MASAAPATQMSPQTANALARQAVLAKGVDMTQVISTQTVNPAQVPVLNIPLRNVGLIKKLLVTIVANITNNDGANALTLTNFGLANLLAPTNGIVLTDLNNNQRIQTGGWHLSMLNSIKQRKPFASGFAVETDTMGGYGETYGILASPANIAAAGNATVRGVYEIPVAYSDDDLRGAIYANVVNATMNLALTFNPAPFTAAGVNSTFAVYKGTANAVVTSYTVTVYQNYLDQLPFDPKAGVILPQLDLSTVYELKNTNLGALAAGNDFPFQYPNFRDVLSTTMIYNHDTSADAGRAAGTDINYFALQSANFTNLWKLAPLDLALKTRQILGCDLPLGAYYSSSRRKPISSVQYGNIEIVINPITAAASAQLYVGLEDFSYPNTIVNAGSIQG